MSYVVIQDLEKFLGVQPVSIILLYPGSHVRIGDCPGFGDCPGSETVHYQRLSTVGDYPRALNEAVIGGCPKDLIYKNKKPFSLDKGSLGETLMTSFYVWHMYV